MTASTLPQVGGVLALLIACVSAPSSYANPPQFEAAIEATFRTFDARQGVAVSAEHFYAINNFSITKHRKYDGEALLQWDGVTDVDGPLIHLDSGVIHDGLLFTSHSNYPHWPMTSSVEVWEAESMQHVTSHNIGVMLSSLTWLDRYQDQWWGAFANYDKVQDGMDFPYGETRNTVVVRFNEAFQPIQNWTLPAAILARMTPMSNSGGSWGDDGLLYLTGHDYPEIYVMELPKTGSELEWVATVTVPGLNGQGIAWDRTIAERRLWAILKSEELVYRIAMPEIVTQLPRSETDYLRKPGAFEKSR